LTNASDMSASKPGINPWPLLTGSSVYLASNLFTAALAFALLPIFTRYLTPSEYGEVAMFQALIAALSALVGLNATAASGRKYYDGEPDRSLRDFVAACLQILLASSVAALLAVLVFAGPLSQLLNLQPHWLPWAVFVCAGLQVMQLRLVQWQVRSQAMPYAVLQSGEAVAGMALSLLLVVGLHQGASGRMTAMIVSAGAFALIALLLLHRSGLLRLFVWRPRASREALAYGGALVPHNAAGFLLSTADRVVVSAELGLAAAGVYMVAAQMAQVVGLLFDAVNKSYVPWLFEQLKAGNARMQRQIVQYTYAWFAVLLSGAILAFLAGPWLVRVVAGDRYASAGELVGWLVLGQVFVGMYLMVTNYLFYAKRTGLLSLVTVGCGLLNIVLLVVLTHTFGVQGAAMAFAIAMGMRFLLTWWAAQRSHPMPWFGTQKAQAV
jgi:O-antigen/teichoic acid export membrane protein